MIYHHLPSSPPPLYISKSILNKFHHNFPYIASGDFDACAYLDINFLSYRRLAGIEAIHKKSKRNLNNLPNLVLIGLLVVWFHCSSLYLFSRILPVLDFISILQCIKFCQNHYRASSRFNCANVWIIWMANDLSIANKHS